MNKKIFFTLIFVLNFLQSSIVQSSQQITATKENSNEEKSVMQKFEQLKNRALQKFNVVKDFGTPRKVKKGNLPEICAKEDKIYFNGTELKFGGSLESWKRIISGDPRCFGKGMTLCIWDDIGLEVGTSHGSPQKVSFLNIHLSFSEDDKYIGLVDYPDGSRADKVPDLDPHHVFSGYLEVDGFGIDSETKFWEIRSGVNPVRSLHCGLLDCSHPAGAFGEKAHIYLILDSGDEKGKLREFSFDAVD